MTAWARYRVLYVMMLPIVIYFAIFSYFPLFKGLQISMQNFRMIGNRPFVGLKNYQVVWHDPVFWRVLENTVVIGIGMLILGFFAPIIAALSLNEVRQTWFKKVTQMVIYLPHLFSWVVVGGIWILMLSPDGGFINELLKVLGTAKPIHFWAEVDYARYLMILTNTWKEMGFTCILYLASIVSISPSLYEAAHMDGAGRWQQLRYVTLPQLIPTMKVVTLLNMIGMLRMFDQMMILSNPAIARKVDVLMTYTYQKGILEFNMGVASAAGFLVVLATLILVFATRKLIRYDEE
ncbi:ABC transporter permease [Paenibacillus pectinilyticus]|uniref:ABC transporter permease n=1 Tax=Paenibacillus pectinilyticus TaxID=512399 RepID=A0A1C1A5P5_9BACL|nr:ABC transporter permease subunit [Paenibacillus pectinilyticus]OCT15867.1 ABC transporter permease [Paenibacillus pectinilyticus]